MKKINIYFIFLYVMLTLGCSDESNEQPQQATEIFTEDFEQFPFLTIPEWQVDALKYDGPYSEVGEFYQEKNIFPPKSYRNSIPIGTEYWLTAELYTRTEKPILVDYLDIVPDPSNPGNKVLQINTPKHTDGVVLRSKNPLPEKYRITLKIGYANYGDTSALNGYNDGNEMAEPWRPGSSVGHNGFYWLAILDHPPKPHNNIWMHHHRKFVIDSWNRKNYKNTINVIALDGKSETHQLFGKKFINYVNERWQKISGTPVDYYLPEEWYKVTFTRTDKVYEFSISGKFKNGGETTYTNKINYHDNCIYHYNQTPEELDSNCVDTRYQEFMGKTFTYWPKNSSYPEYFMIGEPHINYYEGNVLVDDITLEVLQ